MNRYQQNPSRSRAETAKVVHTVPQLHLAGHTAFRGIRQAAPYGVYAKPPIGEELLLLPLASGERIAVGTLGDLPTLQAGEILLQNAAGATLCLKADGSIHLNGLVIDRNGNFGGGSNG